MDRGLNRYLKVSNTHDTCLYSPMKIVQYLLQYPRTQVDMFSAVKVRDLHILLSPSLCHNGERHQDTYAHNNNIVSSPRFRESFFLFVANDRHRTSGTVDHLVRHATQEDPLDSRRAMGAHHNEISLHHIGRLLNFVRRIAIYQPFLNLKVMRR